MAVRVVAIGKPEVPVCSMSDRFRHDISYFMSIPGRDGVPQLPEGEYWVRQQDAQQWYDDGVILLVSPLDSASRAEVELSEEQELWLAWLLTHQVEHLRLE